MLHCIVLLLFSISVVNVATADVINSDLHIKNVDRNIDLTSQLTKISNKVTLENNGKTAQDSFLFTIEAEARDRLSLFHSQTSDSSKTTLKNVLVQIQGHADKLFRRVYFKDALQPGKSVVVEVDVVFTHQLTAYPTSITQKEKQLVLYHGNHYFYSPYSVVKQTAVINLGSRNIENYSKLKPATQSDTSITYGPYEQVGPFSVDKMVIHYENNAPFLTVTSLLRIIEVSHWGNIAVEETINIEHTGAILKGPFSRYEYQRESQSGVSSIKSFKTVLPAAAADVYYRDEIGNISTSHMKVMSDSVELDLRPRFPLFGGWKSHYVIGYNVPSYEYLYNTRDEYLLKMRFLDHIYDNMIVDEAVVKIILPEGAHDILLTPPYPVQRLPDSLHFTYLDVKGRPTITLTRNNLVENHIQDFELQYNFPRMLMLQEPLLVVFAFFLLFLLAIVYVRLDFSITKDEAGENRMRVAGQCEKVLSHHDKRALTYQHFDDQLAKLKTTKDVSAFLKNIKSINQEYKSETAIIAELIVKLKTDVPEVYEKVVELQKVDKLLKDLYNQHQSLYVDKLIPSKINRQSFIDAEGQLNKKKEDLAEKINALVKSLQ